MEGPGAHFKAQEARMPERFGGLVDRLSDLDRRRIGEMDEAAIDVQVLSLAAPGVQQLDAADAVALARSTNDELVDAVRRHPDRLVGLATIATPDPGAAADELERAARDLGFKGAVINGHTRGRYLDDEFFWPILERAEALALPIYLHPALPPQAVSDVYYTGNFPAEVSRMFAMSAWGWHIETAVHVLRLILSGTFDRFPALQLIIGHLGEALPFMIERIDSNLPVQLTGLDQPVGAYLRRNVSYSVSGFNYTPVFLNLLLEVGAQRILFSADYPFASMKAAREFLNRLPVSPADRERIAHENAECLLGL
ncbi:MAG: amidohydrolase family protein [Gemmatimonadota bacterium]